MIFHILVLKLFTHTLYEYNRELELPLGSKCKCTLIIKNNSFILFIPKFVIYCPICFAKECKLRNFTEHLGPFRNGKCMMVWLVQLAYYYDWKQIGWGEVNANRILVLKVLEKQSPTTLRRCEDIKMQSMQEWELAHVPGCYQLGFLSCNLQTNCCLQRGRLEDVVVSDDYRGKQLGKLWVLSIVLLGLGRMGETSHTVHEVTVTGSSWLPHCLPNTWTATRSRLIVRTTWSHSTPEWDMHLNQATQTTCRFVSRNDSQRSATWHGMLWPPQILSWSNFLWLICQIRKKNYS